MRHLPTTSACDAWVAPVNRQRSMDNASVARLLFVSKVKNAAAGIVIVFQFVGLGPDQWRKAGARPIMSKEAVTAGGGPGGGGRPNRSSRKLRRAWPEKPTVIGVPLA